MAGTNGPFPGPLITPTGVRVPAVGVRFPTGVRFPVGVRLPTATGGRFPIGVRFPGVRLPVGMVGLETLGLLFVGKRSPPSNILGKQNASCWNPACINCCSSPCPKGLEAWGGCVFQPPGRCMTCKCEAKIACYLESLWLPPSSYVFVI